LFDLFDLFDFTKSSQALAKSGLTGQNGLEAKRCKCQNEIKNFFFTGQAPAFSALCKMPIAA
jgi:hypothetical protein